MSAALAIPHRTGPCRTRTHRDQPVPARRGGPVAGRRYARRRAVAGSLSAIVVASALMVGFDAVAGPGAAPASASAEQPAGGGSVVARRGDTLWSLAGEHRGDAPLRRYLDAMIDLNGGASIVAGQRVRLP